MSSILDALKKLEQETEEKTTGFLPEKSKNPHGKRKKTLISGLIVLFFFGFVIAGTILFYPRPRTTETETAVLKQNNPASETPATSTRNAERMADPAKIQPQKSLAADAAGDDLAGSGKRTTDLQPAELQKDALPFSKDNAMNPPAAPILPISPPGADMAGKSAGPAISRPEEPAENFVPVIQSLQGKRSPAHAVNVQPDLPASPKTTVRERSAANTAKKEMKSRVAVLADPAIELQAISWSADPEKRLAIINGKICREKETVAGYMVDAIYAEEVVLRKGAVSGKLMFNVR